MSATFAEVSMNVGTHPFNIPASQHHPASQLCEEQASPTNNIVIITKNLPCFRLHGWFVILFISDTELLLDSKNCY